MECPNCQGTLADSASYCGCGWRKNGDKKAKKDWDALPFIQCAHMACYDAAKVRIKTKTGWANMCNRHYSTHFLDSAEKYCYALGLDTTEQKRAWVREKVAELSSRFRPDYLDHDPVEAARKAISG